MSTCAPVQSHVRAKRKLVAGERGVMVGEGQFRWEEWGWKGGVGEDGAKGGGLILFFLFCSESAFYIPPECTVIALHKIHTLE